MKNVAVIDTGYGDGGKGHFTAYLCLTKGMPLVYRFSGGHQAGHTVIRNGIRHVSSSFGSGVLLGVPTYWSEKCTFYPTAFMNELFELNNKIMRKPKIYVHRKCPVTTPYDVNHNRVRDDHMQHGSCGVGFGSTLEREENFYSLLVEDLFYPAALTFKLLQIRKYYGYDSGEIDITDYVKDLKEVVHNIEMVDDFNKVKWMYNTIIYEGSQGLLLDQNIGFFPHVTRSSVGSQAIDDKIDELYYVTRAYQTRHGNGPMTNEIIPHNIAENPRETNVENFQGKFRRSLLDLDMLKYAIDKDGGKRKVRNTSLVITCLDHVENDYRFTQDGEIIYSSHEREFIDKIKTALGFRKVFVSNTDDYTKIREML